MPNLFGVYFVDLNDFFLQFFKDSGISDSWAIPLAGNRDAKKAFFFAALFPFF